jgi:1-acyl-sn-glycerol-3-phosphate acyltransferase
MNIMARYVPGGPENRRFFNFCRAVVRLASGLLFRLDIQGLENIPAEGAAVIVSNHLSGWDIPTEALRPRRIMHFMAKAEYTRIRLLRWLFPMLGGFFVRRGEGDMEAIRNALAVLRAGQLLFIYPEGHRSENHALIPAHDGFALIALRSGVPVIPIATWGSELVGKKGRFGPRRPTIHIRYGTPIQLQSAGKRATREEIGKATETIMRTIASMLPEQYRGVYGAEGDIGVATQVESDEAETVL